MIRSLSTITNSVLAILGGVILGAVTASHAGSPKAASPTPIACHPDALSPEEWKRHSELRTVLFEAVVNQEELSNGFRFQLDGSKATIVQAAEWIDGERRCCPFIEFGLRQPAEGGQLELTLSGRPGVKELLRAQLKGD